MGRNIVFAGGMLLLLPAAAQVDSVAMRYADTITQADLRMHLGVLASDAFEGRETGRKGEDMAGAYIMEQFRKDGIPPIPDAHARGLLPDGYRQAFGVRFEKLGGLSLRVEGEQATFMQDYFYFSEQLKKDLEASEVMVLNPVTAGGTKLGGGAKVVMLLGAGRGLIGDLKATAESFAGTGTQVVLMVNDSAAPMMARYGSALLNGRMRLAGTEKAGDRPGVQVVVITPELAGRILAVGGLSLKKAARKAAKKQVLVKAKTEFTWKSADEQLTGENVLGYVEGSDKKGQVVVVTAHYDHVGVKDGEVYNGADDDGSGTVAVLAMAKAFALAKAQGHGPRRSMLFMTVSGEEKGLLGSQWYTDHPVFPLDSTVADLNIDMIGRVDTVYGDSSRYVYVIGSKRLSTELGRTVEQQNQLYTGLQLDYTFDADNDPNQFYYRSDHYNFAKHGIPVAFFFNGVHEDYHGPHDEVDRIRFDLLQQRTLLVFHTAWAVANGEQRPVVDVKP